MSQANATAAEASSPSSEHRTRLRQTAGYYAAFFAQGLIGAALGPTLPGLAALFFFIYVGAEVSFAREISPEPYKMGDLDLLLGRGPIPMTVRRTI